MGFERRCETSLTVIRATVGCSEVFKERTDCFDLDGAPRDFGRRSNWCHAIYGLKLIFTSVHMFSCVNITQAAKIWTGNLIQVAIFDCIIIY